MTKKPRLKTTKPGAKHSSTSEVPKAIHEGTLEIGDMKIPCAVLESGKRVLSQRQTLETLGRSRVSGGRPGANMGELPAILRVQGLQPFIPPRLRDPNIIVVYQPQRGGRTAHGISAEILPMICEAYLNAAAAGALQNNQSEVVDICRIIQNGLAHVGITALIDEATGYENSRAKMELARILRNYLSDEIKEWTKTFPLDFYRQIYRLQGWEWTELENGKKPPTPAIVGSFTDDLIYKRLAPNILTELRKRNPKRDVRHHQWFNAEEGHPKLRMRIAQVIVVMKLSDDWDDCRRKMDKMFPLQWQEGDLFYIPSEESKMDF